MYDPYDDYDWNDDNELDDLEQYERDCLRREAQMERDEAKKTTKETTDGKSTR